MLGDRSFDKQSENGAAQEELSFDQLLDSMSPREVRARMRAMARDEAKHKQDSDKTIEFTPLPSDTKSYDRTADKQPESRADLPVAGERADNAAGQKPGKMPYDRASNTFMTPEGYILSPGPNPPRYHEGQDSSEARPVEQVGKVKGNAQGDNASEHEETFEEALSHMTPRQVRRRMREIARELEEEREAEKARELQAAAAPKPADADNSKQADGQGLNGQVDDKLRPMHMTYDKASNTYVTDDGYILPGPSKTDRIHGYMLQDELNRIAELQEAPAEEQVRRPAQRVTNVNDQLVDLGTAAGAVDYRALAGSVPVRELYGPGSSSCSEFSVSVDARVLGIAGGGFTIYDKQNEECRLAQTVQHACAIPELLAMDVSNARNVKEMLLKSDAVATASEFCAETIDAANAEKMRLRKEREEEEADD